MTVTTEWSLDSLITDKIEECDGAADPQTIAAELVDEIPDSQINYVLERGLIRIVGNAIGQRRNRALKGKAKKSAKWESVSDSYSSGMIEFMRATVFCGEYKTMGECTIDDLNFAADELRIEATEAVEMAKRYDSITRIMKKKKAGVVGDLSEDDVKKFLDE